MLRLLILISILFSSTAFSKSKKKFRVSVHEMMTSLNASKFTHVDLDGDGKADVVRQWKANGHDLKTIKYIDRTQTPSVWEVVDFTKKPYQVTRKVQALKIVMGAETADQDILISTSHYDWNGGLLKTEILSDPENKNWTKKIVTTREDMFLVRKEFSKSGSQWKVDNEEKTFSLFLQRANNEFEEKYVNCLKEKNIDANLDCSNFVRANVIENFVNIASKYTQLTCQAGDEIFTPSGFRVDAASCGNSPAAMNKIKNAVRKVTEENMKCLAALNPEFAADCAAAFQEKRPKVFCAQGYTSGSRTVEDFANKLCEGRSGSCQSDMRQMYQVTGGFYDGGLPNNLYLTGDDPNRRDPPWNASSEKQLVSTLFHEMLHSCGHDGGRYHNHPHFNDEVYGCEALCGGDASRLTREGCQSCFSARASRRGLRRQYWPPHRNVAQARRQKTKDRNYCNQFPKEAVLRNLTFAMDLRTVLMPCDLNSDGSECAIELRNQLATDRFKNLCNGLDLGNQNQRERCISKFKVKTGKMILEASKAVNGDPEELAKAMAVVATGNNNRV